MALSKKHYETFAERFQQQLFEIDAEAKAFTISQDEAATARRHVAGMAGKLAFTFAYDNPRFDKLRFLAACGF